MPGTARDITSREIHREIGSVMDALRPEEWTAPVAVAPRKASRWPALVIAGLVGLIAVEAALILGSDYIEGTAGKAQMDAYGDTPCGALLAKSELALYMYRSKKGLPPGNLAQLIPEFLSEVPRDPRAPHVRVEYLPAGEGFYLHCNDGDRR